MSATQIIYIFKAIKKFFLGIKLMENIITIWGDFINFVTHFKEIRKVLIKICKKMPTFEV